MGERVDFSPDGPQFRDLPWDRPLGEWPGLCEKLEEVPRGLSRHPVVFVNENGVLYAIKELPVGVAEREYASLGEIARHNVPVVTAIGWVKASTAQGETSLLITRYLEGALPYRLLFMRQGLARYRRYMLDALANLLVELHLAGVYWGDCSLSNTLFRRDAGFLRAYLVDAETAEVYPPGELPPTLRYHDLQIMEEQVDGDLHDLFAENLLDPSMLSEAAIVPLTQTGVYIRLRYQSLWEEITRDETISPEESYRIQERIRALNNLGFSVSKVNLTPVQEGSSLRLRVTVVDRSYYHDQLFTLTGLDADEMQARQLINEIQEVKARLSSQQNRSVPFSVAANHWMEQIYLPTMTLLSVMDQHRTPPVELYCQVLEHKWFLSERSQHDVGHHFAAEDYLRQFGDQNSENPTASDKFMST